MKASIAILAVATSFMFTSCSGSSLSTSSPTTFTVGGTVIALANAGGGLQLKNNGTDTLLVNVNGTFNFPTPLASGSAYNVTVSAQPSSPAQICEVTHGAGAATGNITNVVVDCGHNEWTWVGGANVASQKGTYGTQGVSAPGNIPGARSSAMTWTDAAGNFWLFGGIGYDSAGIRGALNDQWKYGAGQWTWVSGPNVVNQRGTYGIQGTAAPGNIPGGRASAMTWIDAAGNFWLFGGFGLDSSGSNGFLNDLWKYSAGQWMWVSGSNVTGQKGTYGIQGTNASSNIPGAREGAVTWTDAVGNLWLFGGFGFDSTGTLFSYLNDLWKYGAGQWTWMGGSNVANQKGTYGIQGTAAPNNIPGARIGAMNWIDAGGNIWLFGGTGYESTGILGSINDLWKYSAGQWTWIGGPNTANQSGIYGTQGAAAPGNIPGARATGTTWTDTAGNFWLFGGGGYDSIGTHNRLNDLWRYSAGQWTWMGGSQIVNQNGTYGTQGTVAPGNIPGARGLASGWTDAAGNLWFFGGDDHDLAVPSPEQLNDLWKYEP